MKRADHPHAPPIRGLLMALMAIAAGIVARAPALHHSRHARPRSALGLQLAHGWPCAVLLLLLDIPADRGPRPAMGALWLAIGPRSAFILDRPQRG